MSERSSAVSGTLVETLVGTLATPDRPGTIRRLEEDSPLIPALAPGQGVAALVRHPLLSVVYGVSMGPEARLFAWRRDGDGFASLADLPSFGTVACHLAVDPRGEFLVVTNYGSGSLAVFPLDGDGRPQSPSWLETLRGSGPHPDRQEHAHPHHVAFVDDDLMLINDLGTDLIISLRLDRTTGALELIKESPMPAGCGPRHLAFLDAGTVIISGELDNSVILGRLHHDDGAVRVADVAPSSWRSDLRDGTGASKAGDIVTDGSVVYVANRGFNTVAALAVRDGGLIPLDEYRCGAFPQHLDLDRDRLLVACQDSDEVIGWRRRADGRLEDDHSVRVDRPAWLLSYQG